MNIVIDEQEKESEISLSYCLINKSKKITNEILKLFPMAFHMAFSANCSGSRRPNDAKLRSNDANEHKWLWNECTQSEWWTS